MRRSIDRCSRTGSKYTRLRGRSYPRCARFPLAGVKAQPKCTVKITSSCPSWRDPASEPSANFAGKAAALLLRIAATSFCRTKARIADRIIVQKNHILRLRRSDSLIDRIRRTPVFFAKHFTDPYLRILCPLQTLRCRPQNRCQSEGSQRNPAVLCARSESKDSPPDIFFHSDWESRSSLSCIDCSSAFQRIIPFFQREIPVVIRIPVFQDIQSTGSSYIRSHSGIGAPFPVCLPLRCVFDS